MVSKQPENVNVLDAQYVRGICSLNTLTFFSLIQGFTGLQTKVGKINAVDRIPRVPPYSDSSKAKNVCEKRIISNSSVEVTVFKKDFLN